MINYTTKITEGSVFIPNTKLINNQYVDVSEEEKQIKVLNVTTEDDINNRTQIKELVNSIYPEIVEVLGDDDMMGLRINIKNEILRALIPQNESLNEIEKRVLRQYVAEIELPLIINKGIKENDALLLK